MFCINCGESIIEGAKFCAKCGKPTTQTKQPSSQLQQPALIDWEYTYYRRSWEKGGRYNLLLGTTEYSVRLELWGEHQSEFLHDIQEYLDKGWQPISPPGPGSYNFLRHEAYISGIKYNWLQIRSFILELRRPATIPLLDKEKLLLGVWEEPSDPSTGFGGTMAKILLFTKLKKRRVEFFKDHTFYETNQREEKQLGGVYYSTKTGEITLDFVQKIIGIYSTAIPHWGYALRINRQGQKHLTSANK